MANYNDSNAAGYEVSAFAMNTFYNIDTTTPLNAAAVFTSQTYDIIGAASGNPSKSGTSYRNFSVVSVADVAYSIQVEISIDGTNWYSNTTSVSSAAVNGRQVLSTGQGAGTWRYMRYKITCGGANMAYLISVIRLFGTT